MNSTARLFRPGATLVPLFFWAMMTGFSGSYALKYLFEHPPSVEARVSACLIVLFAFLFGPVAFIVHFVRFCLVSVTVDPDRGLVLSGGRIILFTDVVSVEVRQAAFEGTLRMNPVLLFMTAGCMAIIYYVILPSFTLFTPWHRRVILVLRDGKTKVFGDLIDAEGFAGAVAAHGGIRRVEESPNSNED